MLFNLFRLKPYKLLLLMIGLFSFAAFPSTTMAQSSVTITIDDSIVDPDDTVTVPIVVGAGTESVGAITIELAYDDLIVSATGCDAAGGTISGVCNFATSGEVLATGIASSGFSGDLTIATITFDVVGSAGESTDLSLIVTTLSDPTGNTLDSTVNNGTISITGAANTPTAVPPTAVPPTEVPPAEIPPTAVPPAEIPPTEVPPTAIPPTGSCGPLVQEAEAGLLSGFYEIGTDVNASGGEFVHVPFDSPNTGFGNTHVAEYCMTVTEAGDYRLFGDLLTASGLSDSVFVTVDGLLIPDESDYWQMSQNDTYVKQYLTGRNSQIEAVLPLNPGEYTIRLHQRDDGVLWDRVGLELVTTDLNTPVPDTPTPAATPPAPIPPIVNCGPLVQEAEAGLLRGGIYEIGTDENASGGAFVHVPFGSPNSGFGNIHVAEYCMTVVTPGDYLLFGDILAASGFSDSVFVTVNGEREPLEPDYWQMSQNNTYEQQYLTSRETAEQSVLSLAPGEYTIRLHQRDDGVQWDRVGLELLTENIVDTPTPAPPTPVAPTAVAPTAVAPTAVAPTAVAPTAVAPTAVAPTAVPPTDNSVNIQAGNVTFNAGSSDSVDITLQSGDIKIGAFTIDLTYDPSVFTATGCQSVDFQSQCNVATPGQIQLTGIDAEGISGNSTLATIMINGVGAGTSELAIAAVTTLADLNGITQTATTQNGQVVVNSAPLASCGPLQQEAENGTLSGNFIAQSDAAASGGLYVASTRGVVTTGPDGTNFASYCFTVPTAGRYRVAAKTFAATEFNDSFYVQIDGMPSQGYLWGVPISNGYIDGYASDRGGMNPIEVSLTAGDHEVVFSLRESGTKLDKVALELIEPVQPPPSLGSCSGLQREAEEGVLFGGFAIGNDAAASGGQYVHVTNGPDEYGGPNTLRRADYCFTVAEAGEYKIKANVYGRDNGENSFYVRLRGEPANTYRWNTLINTSYDDDYVTNSGVSGITTLSLTPGEHTVSVYLREIKTRLDKIELELNGSSPVAPTPTPIVTPPPPTIGCGALQQEAEAGRLTNSAFTIGSDPAASGGQYIHAVNGPDEYDGPNAARGTAEYCFTVDTAGLYLIKTNVYGRDNGENSFYVQVNGQPMVGYRWNTFVNTSYSTDYVRNAGVFGPVILLLTPGEYTVTVYMREIKTRLDTIALVSATDPVLLAANDIAGPPSSMGAHGTVQVQDSLTSRTVDPDSINFAQFSMTLAASDGAEYSMPLDSNGYYRFDDLPAGDYQATLNMPEGYTSQMPQPVALSLDNDEIRRIDPDVTQNITQRAIQEDNQQFMFLPFLGK